MKGRVSPKESFGHGVPFFLILLPLITQILPLSDLKGILVSPGLIDPDSMVAIVGNLKDLPTPHNAIVNSRQHRNPHADDSWLSASINALENAIASQSTIISSVGMTTWEWIVWNTNRLGGYQIIVIPRGKVSDFSDRVVNIIQEFNLDENKTVFLMPCFAGHSPRKRITYPERDRWVMALSHRILPISVRPSGILSKLLNEPAVVSHIVPSFQTQPATKSAPDFKLRNLLTKDILAAAIEKLTTISEWDYLTHWTRRCHGPWQGERKADYYHDLFQAKAGDPRDGLCTLKRILKEGRIRSSGKLIKGGNPMVSLTATSPHQLLDIIRWRPGFVRWNFEPYGISIKKQKLKSLGARPVTYGTLEQYEGLSETEKLFFQSIESKGKDWSIEEEWRLPGDLDLSKLHSEDAIIWVMNSREVGKLQEVSRFPVKYLIAK
jgi:hypothetical protein